MAYYPTEVFGCLTYHQELTYEELIEREATLMEVLQSMLEELGGVCIGFTQTGDTLLVQSQFAALEPHAFAALCEALQVGLARVATGRFLLLNKSLNVCQVGNIVEGQVTVHEVSLEA